MNLMELQIITSNWEYGAGKKGTSEGPQALLESLRSKGADKLLQLPLIDVEQTVEYEDVKTIHYPRLKRAKPLIEHQERLASTIELSRKNFPFQLLLTGDHSNAIGGLAGFCRKGDSNKKGIIWIDAHLDLHSPYTTPSGNIHGMSVNTALDIDNKKSQVSEVDADCKELWKTIKSLKKNHSIPPRNIVFIGIRSFEEPELKLVQNEGIKVIHAEEIHQKGIEWAVQECTDYLKEVTDEWYVSFDVDTLDPSVSKGTGTPVKGGLSKKQAFMSLDYFIQNDKTRVLEITEINPSLDTEKPMADGVADLLIDLFE